MAREMDMKELQTVVLEVMEKVEKDLEKVKAKEVKPDGYADTLEKPVDWESKLGLSPSVKAKAMLESLKKKEEKAARIVKTLRAQRKSLMEKIEKEELAAENTRLREAIKKVKKAK